jgi:zinc transport system substrate-binding protein
MSLRLLLSGLFAATFLAAAGCSAGADPWPQKPGPRVLAFFPPLYSLAAQVAGDDATVLSLLTTKGPHEYEPTHNDARKLHRADLFLTVGLGLDDAVTTKLKDSSGNAKLKVVELGERLPPDMLRRGHKAEAHDGHDHGDVDPHVWLGIPEAVNMVETIRDELAALDPPHADGYRRRAAETAERLRKLQAEGKAQLAAKAEKPRLLSFHDALYYFARSFDVVIEGYIEAPGQEPSAKRVKDLVALCKEKQVRLIAVEPQYPSNTGARLLLDELRRQGIPDAAFVEIDPMETADIANLTTDYYERTTRANVETLAKALK